MSPPLPVSTDANTVAKLMAGRVGANLGLYGSVARTGAAVRLEARCIDLRRGGGGLSWQKVFQDATERTEAVISKAVAEALTGREEWKPPEYGDEAEPRNFGPPINRNGGFDAPGHVGWQEPDNVASFIEKGPAGRGNVLRIQTDLARWPYIEYVRAIRMGKASPANPPKIGRDTGFSSLGGNEGVHFKSEWIKATPGQRYWLATDYLGAAGKIFVKGFKQTEFALDGLSESSLSRLGLTPQQFARLPEDRRKKLIDEEAKHHPELFRRECYRWYLNCRGEAGKWNHLAAPVPPRGGLPAYVEWLQIQVYSYWPAGTYCYDNVHFYRDPNQKAPLPEEGPRTPNFGKTSDVIERQTPPAGDK